LEAVHGLIFDLLPNNILMSLLGKRILVIGGNGFAGNHIAAQLVSQQASVAVLSRYGTSDSEKDPNTTTPRTKKSIGFLAIFCTPKSMLPLSTALM
jgi:hypothetical protein